MIILKKWVTGEIEDRSILNENRALKEPTVNWSAAGAQSLRETHAFAVRLLEICDELSKMEGLKK